MKIAHLYACRALPQGASNGIQRVVALNTHTMRRVARASLAGLVSGGVLGVVDLGRTVAGGYAASFGALDLLWFAVIGIGLVAGSLVGFGWGLLLSLLAFVGVRWDDAGLSFRERSLLSVRIVRAAVLSIAFAGVLLVFNAEILGPVGIAGLTAVGLYQGLVTPATIVAVLGGVSVLGLVAFGVLSRRRVAGWHHAATWLAVTAAFFQANVDHLYYASRLYLAMYLHLATTLLLLGGATIGAREILESVGRPTPGGGRRALLLVGVAIALFPCATVASRAGPHSVRHALFDRTVLPYRMLRHNPMARAPERAELASAATCEESVSFLEPFETPTDVARQAPQPQVRGVVFIFVDALRYDRLGAKRDGVPLTPNLDELRRSGVSFDRAYTPTPATMLTLNAMLTGVITGTYAWPYAESGDLSILHLMEDAGIGVSAVLAYPRLDGWMEGTRTRNLVELQQENDPDEQVETHQHLNRRLPVGVSSKLTTMTAVEELERWEKDDRFFLFVHYVDPHHPYSRNAMFDFGDAPVERYDAEIAYTDHWVGELIDATRERHGDDVAIVVVSDHGEEFGEHHYALHGVRLYEESTRVVTMIDLPGVTTGDHVDTVVTMFDVAPTILDLLGVPPQHEMHGQSLNGFVRGAAPFDDRGVFLAAARRGLPPEETPVGIVDDRQNKLIVEPRRGVLEFYRMSEDPEERINLADEAPPEMTRLRCLLQSWTEEIGMNRRWASEGHNPW